MRRVGDHNINFEGGASGFVRKISTAEFTDGHTDSEVGNDIDSIKAALTETFLFDMGATVSIIGQQVATDNHLSVNKLDSPRNIVEASGAKLDIIG